VSADLVAVLAALHADRQTSRTPTREEEEEIVACLMRDPDALYADQELFPGRTNRSVADLVVRACQILRTRDESPAQP
jgi:hypothetical protein